MTERERTGGPAFPTMDYENTDRGPGTVTNQEGMSLRDYFAGQALAGLATSYLQTDHAEDDTAAAWAYDLADAMLRARAVV